MAMEESIMIILLKDNGLRIVYMIFEIRITS